MVGASVDLGNGSGVGICLTSCSVATTLRLITGVQIYSRQYSFKIQKFWNLKVVAVFSLLKVF